MNSIYLVHLFMTLGSVIQLQNAKGEIVSYKTFSAASPNSFSASNEQKFEVSEGEVYVHDFSQSFSDEFRKEFPLSHGYYGLGRAV